MHALPAGIRTRQLRVAAAGMVAIAAAWPIVPHPGVACPLRAAIGIPCPFCGMTRAVVAAVHGHLGASLAFNPGGLIVLLCALAAVARPAWLRRALAPPWTILAGLGALWVWNIGFNPTFHQLLLR